LIIAHAGIADMARLARVMAGRRGVFFDTSTWSPVDLLDFYRQIPPEQVVYASDYPYGGYTTSLFLALKTARLAGYDDDQLRAMLTGNATRIANGEELAEPSHPVGGADTLVQTDAARPDPPVRLDVYTAPLVAAARHDGDARARDQHVRRAKRASGDSRQHPRPARGSA